MKHPYLLNERLLKMQLTAKIITESEYKKRVKEAIVDDVSDQLSDIFDNPEDITKAKLKGEVKSNINKGLDIIKKQFPDLKIIDHFVVGAAVTYQYAPGSDIDTTVVLDKSTDPAKMKEVDKWIEANLDGKMKHNARPYQFKVSFDGRDKVDNADAVYDEKANKWIKQPDVNKAKEMYQKKVMDPNSEENKLYGEIEKMVQPSLLAAYNAITGKNEAEGDSDIELALQTAYGKYSSGIKKLRGKAYAAAPESGYVSQNWGKGNVIYKMFDREGYNNVYSQMKDIIKGKKFTDQAALDSLKTSLEKVIKDEPGYKP